LHLLGITTQSGEVKQQAQDKYKQINHYIEILSKLLEQLPQNKEWNIADMGAGKGYLTFALYDYIVNVLGKTCSITGVEYRQDLVDKCNKIASICNFQQLFFKQGTIFDYKDNNGFDVLIALHACDTATDDAIVKGIENDAALIVVAPCCHKQIRRQMEKRKYNQELSFLLNHGIFMERQAEMITDGLRALLLEYSGYKTRVFDFISDAHTPKNVLIVAEKQHKALKNRKEILEKIYNAKQTWGIENHYLEQKLGLDI
jgi:SAM-dependent methyltransferase